MSYVVRSNKGIFVPPTSEDLEKVAAIHQPAVDVVVEDLDREEILRTRDAAVRGMRISAGTSMDPGDIPDRLGLMREGVVTQAAQMLYGTHFLPDYPQGRLKLGRFRGTKITGDILDNRQEYLHAFAAVREGMAFLERTLPLSGHFVEGRIEREDRLALPPDALREVTTPQVTPQATPQVTPQVLAVLSAAESPTSRSELQAAAGLKDRKHLRIAVLEPLLAAGWLEMTIPDKPRSSKQRYRTTEAGKRVLDEAEREESGEDG